MKRILRGIFEWTAGLAIFAALVAVYNLAAPWEPGTWAYFQRQIGGLMQWITVGIGVLVLVAWVSWKVVAALLARSRHLR